ncbi:MAG: hypothetical protein P8N31_01620, partial [Planctomycetota bacterium]|nr:hypothetical protein [Planctomycetota bacterium]
MRASTATTVALLTITLASDATAQGGTGVESLGAYNSLDAVEGSFVNLATFPVRPMVYMEDNRELWAVNHHDSTVEIFVGASSEPVRKYGVPWGPVSIAHWSGPDAGTGAGGNEGTADDELLVVCRGTWGVVRMRRDTGEIIQVHQLGPNSSPEFGSARMGG